MKQGLIEEQKSNKVLWNEASTGYLCTFCHKHGYDSYKASWKDGKTGTIAVIEKDGKTIEVPMDIIRYDTDNKDIEENVFTEWVENGEKMEALNFGRTRSYEEFCSGGREEEKREIERWEELKKAEEEFMEKAGTFAPKATLRFEPWEKPMILQ